MMVEPSDIVAQVDETLNNVFQQADNHGFFSRPRERFKLYVPLLRGFGEYSPGFENGETIGRIKGVVGEEAAEEILTAGEQLESLLSSLVEPTYSATSYWSPIDLLRHTVVHRGQVNPKEQRLVLSSAYLFYALTFAGEKYDLYSVIQFLALEAKRKAGIRAWFMESKPPDGSLWWHIPPWLDDSLLSALGLEDGIANLAESDVDIEATLSTALANEVGRQWWDCGSRAASLLERIDVELSRLKPDLESASRANAQFLTQVFGKVVSVRQAGFMLATHLLWRRACPSECMYTFPVLVGETCCVLTIGTSAPVEPIVQVALGSIAKSIFIRPLLLDYAAKEAEAKSERRTALFRHLLSHNLPKLLISPATTEFTRMSRVLEQLGPKINTDLSDSINRLKLLFRHYEKFLMAILVPRTLGEEIKLPPADRRPIDFLRDVKPLLQTAFAYLRTRVLDRDLKESLVLRLDVPDGFVLRGHIQSYLIEIMLNLLSNAVDALVPAEVKVDPDRAIVDIKGRIVTAEYVSLSVADHGPGFAREKLQFYRSVLERLENVAREQFWDTIDDLVERGVTHFSREEHMGVGLIFCALYARAVEWQDVLRRPGRLCIDSVPGLGTTVTLLLPIAPEEF